MTLAKRLETAATGREVSVQPWNSGALVETVGPRPQLLDGEGPGRPCVAKGGDVSGQAGPCVGTDSNKIHE